jgi:hypothetical protein
MGWIRPLAIVFEVLPFYYPMLRKLMSYYVTRSCERRIGTNIIFLALIISVSE